MRRGSNAPPFLISEDRHLRRRKFNLVTTTLKRGSYWSGPSSGSVGSIAKAERQINLADGNRKIDSAHPLPGRFMA